MSTQESLEDRLKRLAARMAAAGGNGKADYSDCTAELLDESDEHSPVVIRGPFGHALALMPREQWEAIREMAEGKDGMH